MHIRELIAHGVAKFVEKMLPTVHLCDSCHREPGSFEYGKQNLCLGCMRQSIQENHRKKVAHGVDSNRFRS